MKISAIIIDDEKLARSRLRRMLEHYNNVEIVGEAENGQVGLKFIQELQPAVVFLDIKMPSLSGFEMLERVKKSPYIIFTTAYDQYALQAFEENTVDYLMKPIDEKKLRRAMTKVTNILQQGEIARVDLKKLLNNIVYRENILRRFSVKLGDRILLFNDDDIYFFQSKDKYTFLNTVNKDYIISFTLKSLMGRLDPNKFSRVNRAYIINIDHIDTIHTWFGGKLLVTMKNDKEIEVSRGYVHSFKQKVNL